jgi:hypothetical protein
MFNRAHQCLIIETALSCPKNGKNSSAVMEIPAYMQKLNQEFLSRKRSALLCKKAN